MSAELVFERENISLASNAIIRFVPTALEIHNKLSDLHLLSVCINS